MGINIQISGDVYGTLHVQRITVGTVHSLQGAEQSVVLFSPANTKESSPHVRRAGSGKKTDAGNRSFQDKQKNLLHVAVSRAKDSFIVVSDMSHFDSGDDGTPSGTLVQMMFARPDSEIVMALPSAISSTLNKGVVPEDPNRVALQRIATQDGHRSVLARAFDPVDGARSEIVMTSPWITESALRADNVMNLVAAAKGRGVKVRIFADEDFNQGTEAKAGSFDRNVKALRDAGAEVSVVKMIHSKVIYSDDAWKCVGSFNWLSSPRNEDYSRREVSALIEAASFVRPNKIAEIEALEGMLE